MIYLLLIEDNEVDNQQIKTLHAVPTLNGYFCDEDGNIYSRKQGDLRKLKPHITKARGRKPYLRIKLSDKLYLVHRIVASAKYGRFMNSEEFVNHINANTVDNSFNNVEIVTHKENVQHAIDNNLYCSGRAWYEARGLNFIDYPERE